MRARHPRLEVFTARGQGHAPLLIDAPAQSAIQALLQRADREAPAAALPLPALG
jgi:hypothetical protein